MPIDPDDERPITRGQAERLIGATQDAVASTNRLADTNSWRRFSQIVLVCVVAAVAVLSVTNYLLYRQVQNTASCRTSFATARADALDDWIRSFPTTPPKTAAEQEQVRALSAAKQAAYLKVSNQYINAVKDHC